MAKPPKNPPPPPAETKSELEESTAPESANEPENLAATADEAPAASDGAEGSENEPETSENEPEGSDDASETPGDEPEGEIPTRAKAKKPFTVWDHGSLLLSGVTHGPGATVLLTEAQAKALGEVVTPAKKA